MGARQIRPDVDLDLLFGPAWIALQSHYPELPECHFMPMQHENGHAAIKLMPGDRVAVHVSPGMLNFHPEFRFLTFMHEAAHALDYARNGSMSGHGKRFADIVQAMGMATQPPAAEQGTDYYEPEMTSGVRERCADVLALLSGARWDDSGSLVQQ